MTIQISDLADCGWSSFFSSQLRASDLDNYFPVWVTSVHRNALQVVGLGFEQTIPPFCEDLDDETTSATVGDWLLLDPDSSRAKHLLQRKSLFKRRAAGTGRKLQLIAANVDTLFIVTSCNQDFNIARLERYLALAREAEVQPVIILTKADLAKEPETFVQQAYGLAPGLVVEKLDARDPCDTACLEPWCKRGQMIALIGSSGVGKSTLVNTLSGDQNITTKAIREDDAKGRHTTTGRQLHPLPMGGWLLDTPGMRELQLTDAHQGLSDVFGDIVELAGSCRFKDCQHETEPDCAVQEAVTTGQLEAERLQRWKKLVAEEAFNRESLVERRSRDRSFGKMVKQALKDKHKYR